MTTQPPRRRPDRRAVVVYTLARFALFAGCLALGWLAGLTGLWLLVVALLVSGLLSWFLLQRQRLAMGAAVDAQVQRVRSRMQERTAAEDAYVDEIYAAADDDRRG
ncbi:MAG TPA: DUF4229 domain-containing protein [Mycobacteriales bacterium]|nr:DUF4229 domain-containing protein [Mycobacteriales bacterium]